MSQQSRIDLGRREFSPKMLTAIRQRHRRLFLQGRTADQPFFLVGQQESEPITLPRHVFLGLRQSLHQRHLTIFDLLESSENQLSDLLSGHLEQLSKNSI